MRWRGGFRVVLPDADLHGERFDGNEQRRLASFWEILKRNIDELPALKAQFEQRGLIADGRIGVAGASMGGMTTLGCFARYPWVNAAASLMGSGYYTSLAQTLFPPLDEQGNLLTAAGFAARIAVLADYGLEYQLERLPIARCCCGTARRTMWCRRRKACVWRPNCARAAGIVN